MSTLKKATKAEIELRVATVYEMVLKGCSRKFIVRYSSENWKIGERQVDDYLAKVNFEIKENFGEKYKENIIAKHLAQLDELFKKNYTIEDFRECRNLIESKNKMLGLNAPIRTDITTNGKEIIYRPLWGELDSVFEDDKTDDSE